MDQDGDNSNSVFDALYELLLKQGAPEAVHQDIRRPIGGIKGEIKLKTLTGDDTEESTMINGLHVKFGLTIDTWVCLPLNK